MKSLNNIFLLIAVSFLYFTSVAAQETNQTSIRVLVRPTLDSLIAKEDTDGDKKITIDDPHVAGTDRGNKRFWIMALDGKKYEVAETYYLANLLED